MRHLLVTNDFPPKIGGIQSYLWEIWRRLPAEDVTVLTTPQRGWREFDAAAPMRIVRTRQPVMLPEPWLRQQVRALADETRSDLVLFDPVAPVGLLGPSLGRAYGVVLHGAEITMPGRLPGPNLAMRAVLRGSRFAVSAGGYPLAEAQRCAGRSLPHAIVPPGVDTDRFRPLGPGARRAARRRFGLPERGRVVLGLSRLVPRKGLDTLIEASSKLAVGRDDLVVAIAGIGRDAPRLRRLADGSPADVRMLGRIEDDDLADLYACADVFTMLCRDRWWGLEQEGFGIVFLEAAACGVPQVAGRSGGAHEAVEAGVTGEIVDEPGDADAVADAIARLLDDPDLRRRQGEASRRRAVGEFDYDHIAGALRVALNGLVASTT